MNEIDRMTHICKKKIFEEEISKQWLQKALAKRLERLHQKISVNESLPGLNELKTLLAEAQALCEFRNKIAHGSFVINCDRPMTTDPDSQLEIFAVGHAQTLTEEDLMNKAARCQEISNGISRQIAIAEIARVRRKDG